MNSTWQTFLEDTGAFIEDDEVVHFGNPEQEIQVSTTGNIIADLSHEGILTAHGKDAAGFLQGQLTNDITLLDQGTAQLSGYCNPKGRLLAIFRIFLQNDGYALSLPRNLVADTLERLQKYVLMSQLSLEDASEQFTAMGCSGPDSVSELGGRFSVLPERDYQLVRQDGVTVIRLPGPQPRFALYGKTAAMQRIWMVLDARAAPVGKTAWQRLDILAGIPAVFPETAGEFIPQTVNLERVHGVSFKKGCYTGQEIVARIQYRGTVKRRMQRIHIVTDECPPPGSALFSQHDTRQSVGTLVSATPAPDGGCDALAVISNEAVQQNDLHLFSNKGARVLLETLPYSLADD